ncbi:MAG: trans-2-enoyl-CoA reductase [Chloroflexi bacterium]|jgi:NADPH:quinone reductase-like Zn-dependent oxidoreductase|nr:trans-2-enoyl-CoA reductase [Chloroflexota bacterium]
MKALQLPAFGPPAEATELVDVESPAPGRGEVAVAIEAAPINPSDLLLIAGTYGYRPHLPAALGAEGVGRIVAVGDGVDATRVGERVTIIPNFKQGTWREQAIVDAGDVVSVDRDADPLQLSMIGINPITAHVLLHDFASLQQGAWVAQTGAASAVGRYVIALARHAGLRTLNVVRRATAVQELLDAGADAVVVSGGDLSGQVAAALGGQPISLILDAVGGDPVTELTGSLTVGGTVVSYAALDRRPVIVPPGDLIYRNLSVHGFWLKNWLDSTPSGRITETYRRVAALVADGTLSAPVDAVYALEDHRAAITHAKLSGRKGKVLFSLL